MDNKQDEQISHLRAMIRKSRELARQSHVLRLRSEGVIAETETLLQKYRLEQAQELRKKLGDT
jgi:hypothetical protein